MTPTMRYAIALSLIFHTALAAYFFASRSRSLRDNKRGSISVDFIESIEHPEHADPPVEPGAAKHDKSEARPPSRPERKSRPAGDPHAVATESNRYIAEVTKLINQRKVYPRSAIDREEEGRVVIGVSLGRDGRVIATKIEEPSPFSSLNEAAADTVTAVGQFPPLPEAVPEPMHLHIPLNFKIERH